MNKKIISLVVGGILLSSVNVYAEEAVVTTTATPVAVTLSVTPVMEDATVVVPVVSIPSSVGPVTERSEVIGAKNIERIKARGAQLIKERVNSLMQNKTAVEKSKGLTAEQKLAFAAFFDGKVLELTTLGTKIASSTEASSTKMLVESIFSEHRIYAVVLPQVRLQKRIYEVQNHIGKVNESLAKVQTNIDYAKSKGKDVTAWQKSLDDAKMLVATDTVKLSALMTKISAMKLSDYPTNSKMMIKEVNSGVQSIAKDINTVSKKVRRPAYMKEMRTSTSTPAVETTPAVRTTN